MKNYYQILGVSSSASKEEIKIAYKKLAIKLHPDLNDGDDFFKMKFQEIQEAYGILSDPIKGTEYKRTFQEWESGSQNQFSGQTYNPQYEPSTSTSESKKGRQKKKSKFKWLMFLLGIFVILIAIALIFYLDATDIKADLKTTSIVNADSTIQLRQKEDVYSTIAGIYVLNGIFSSKLELKQSGRYIMNVLDESSIGTYTVEDGYIYLNDGTKTERFKIIDENTIYLGYGLTLHKKNGKIRRTQGISTSSPQQSNTPSTSSPPPSNTPSTSQTFIQSANTENNRIELYISLQNGNQTGIIKKPGYSVFYDSYFLSSSDALTLGVGIVSIRFFDNIKSLDEFNLIFCSDLADSGWKNFEYKTGPVGERNRIELYAYLKINKLLNTGGKPLSEFFYTDFKTMYFGSQANVDILLNYCFEKWRTIRKYDYTSDLGFTQPSPDSLNKPEVKPDTKPQSTTQTVVNKPEEQPGTDPSDPDWTHESKSRRELFKLFTQYYTLFDSNGKEINDYLTFFKEYFFTAEKAKASYNDYLDLVDKIKIPTLSPAKFYSTYYSDLNLAEIKTSLDWPKLIPKDTRSTNGSRKKTGK